MLIAAWNVNSISARLAHFCSWLESAKPDVALVQELKTTTENFPTSAIEAAGYQAAVLGQKAYNGVAIIARHPIENVQEHLPLRERQELSGEMAARYIEATVNGVRVASVYVPNGESATSPKFSYKMGFYQDLYTYLDNKRYEDTMPYLLGGDFNVAHQPLDLHALPKQADRLLYTPQERTAFRRLLHLGYTDTFRALHPDERRYSWWDYRAGQFERDEGWRIDYLLASSRAMERVVEAGIDASWRGLEKPSDHTVVWCRLKAQA
jgi:exodeoxyribonuclease III